ncbi:MAG: hypothetical protein KH939_09510 [Firmicutes bacterium]|jgi:hypothetical protein|nr:hypothetical protein [Bacillota bacterium]
MTGERPKTHDGRSRCTSRDDVGHLQAAASGKHRPSASGSERQASIATAMLYDFRKFFIFCNIPYLELPEIGAEISRCCRIF